MEKVLIVGVIVLPIVIFLAVFSDNLTEDTQTNATTAKSEAEKLMKMVTE